MPWWGTALLVWCGVAIVIGLLIGRALGLLGRHDMPMGEADEDSEQAQSARRRSWFRDRRRRSGH